MPRREIPPARRSPGLHINRPALRRAHRVQRPAHLEEFSFMVDRMNLGVIGVDSGLAVQQHRAFLPAFEQLADHRHIFFGHFIAQLARRQFVQPEIARREILRAGDHVPAEAALRQAVHRGTQPRQQKGRIGQRRHRRDHAEMPRRHAHGDRQRHRVMLRHHHAAAQPQLARAAIGLGHHQLVLDHDVIEAGALQRLRHLDIETGHPRAARPGRPARATHRA
jgi:hypothetical protein